MELCREIIVELQKQIKSFPKGFYDTFEYTITGNNLTHPLTLGILCKIVWGIRNVSKVYFDGKFNSNGHKFQPDIAAFDKDDKPIIFLDYESPNSSDARVPDKDVKAYTNWMRTQENQAPYLIIITLPDKEALDWEIRWTVRGQWNYLFRDNKSKSKIKRNPLRFWRLYYRNCLKGKDARNVFIANINGSTVNLIKM